MDRATTSPRAGLVVAPQSYLVAARAVADAWLAAGTLAALFVSWRRLEGYGDRPLSVAALLVALAVATMSVVGPCWLMPRRGWRCRGRAFDWRVPVLLAIWLGAVVAGQPWQHGALAAVVWLGTALALSRGRSNAQGDATCRVAPLADLWRSLASSRQPPRRAPRTRFALRQQLVRFQGSNGADVLRGRIREPVAPGQRTAVVHVAFCPPFAEQPELMVRQQGGPDARIKVGPLWAHGARLEIKLNRPTPRTSVVSLSLSARR